jgi:hypothetical protein
VCLLCAAWVAASSSGESYRVCDLETSAMRWLGSEFGCCTNKKKEMAEYLENGCFIVPEATTQHSLWR